MRADLGRFLRVKVTYRDGTTDDNNINDTVVLVTKVGPINRDPAFEDDDDDGTADPVSVTVDESAATDHVVVTVAADDPNEDDTLTYSLAGDTAEITAFNAAFDFDTATAAVTVKSDSALDYEARTSYTVTVLVSDSKDPFATADTAIDDMVVLTIRVRNIEDNDGVITADLDESAPPTLGVPITVSLIDRDTISESNPTGSVIPSWRWEVAAPLTTLHGRESPSSLPRTHRRHSCWDGCCE